MRALIMAGGEGSRLNLGEKPLILLCGQPMIAYVIRAFQLAGCEPVVAVSPRTPMTTNWCRTNGIAFCTAAGKGFVEDMVHVVRILEEEKPLFISASDIPCVTADIVSYISRSYGAAGKDALSTWVPASLVRSCRGSMPYREIIDGIESCPAGINILRGDCIDEIQDERALLIEDIRLAMNINTRADLTNAEMFMMNEQPEQQRNPGM